MKRDRMGLEAPTAVWGICLCAQQGPSLKRHTHLACEQPAPNLAASQPATTPLLPDWDGSVSLRYTGCSASGFVRV